MAGWLAGHVAGKEELRQAREDEFARQKYEDLMRLKTEDQMRLADLTRAEQERWNQEQRYKQLSDLMKGEQWQQEFEAKYKTPPVDQTAIKGTPEWARVEKQRFDEGQARLTRESDAAKLAEKQKGADQYLRDQKTAMERQLAAIAGFDVANLQPGQLESAYGANTTLGKPTIDRIDKAAGFIDAMFPAMSQDKADMEVAINSLKELGQTFGLQQLRSSGVAPGSVTEREWSKFERMLGTFDLRQDPKLLYNQLQQVYSQLNKARDVMQAEGYSAPAAPQDAVGTVQPGTIEDGHIFMGGNPADSKNWKPLGGQ